MHPCTLEGSPFGLSKVRQASSDALDALLQSIWSNVDVDVVVEGRLWDFFHHYTMLGSDRLKELGIGTIVPLESHYEEERGVENTVVFVVQPVVSQVYLVARRIGQYMIKRKTRLQCFIFHTGQWNIMCNTVLKQENIAEKVDMVVKPFHLGFIPLDTDLLTMGRDTLLRECYIGGNKSGLMDIAIAIQLLQQVVGEIGHIFYKGNLAKGVWKALTQLHTQHGSAPPASSKKQRIDCMILLDRKLDYFSPLSTPLTFEGLLEELLEFKDGVVQVDANLLDDSVPVNQNKAPLSLSNDDIIFQKCRDIHIQALGPFLHSEVTILEAEHDTLLKSMHGDNVTMAAMSELPGQVKAHLHQQVSLNQHIHLSESIQQVTNSKSFRRKWLLERAIMEREQRLGDIELLIWKHAPLFTILRLLCLHSLVNDGIPFELYYHLKTQIMQFYGYEYLHSFDNLEQIGLLSVHGASPPQNILNLFEAVGHYDENVIHPDDAAYVSGGFRPLLIKLVEAAIGPKRWESIGDLLNQLPGPSATFSNSEIEDKPKKFKKILVVVIGGISFMEIAALRFLGQKKKCSFLIASNTIGSGKNFLEPILEIVYIGLDDDDIK
ncbi:vacuolar protein sorting-associated protein 33A [Thraustotheca clavata]|uniref:Vacuolar protein sorting-associated protein 33A n=1 Tax=Thraustotheca clavata TaxID=74557 RepID=A0A1V9ZLV8_9STRA|nr:vacuolar protein sorting-associated protein 33A [Thraustotheca clavata]